MCHPGLGFQATAICDGGVMGFALGRPRVGEIVNSSERSTTDVLADPVSSLEYTSMAMEYQMFVD